MDEITFRELKEGYEIHGEPKSITMERMRAFSWWPLGSLHTDDEIAKHLGFPSAIAQALMTHAYLTELMTRLFGDRWFRGGKITLTFLGAMFPGDQITAKAVVRSREPIESDVRFTFGLWCENQCGEKVTVGSATGVIPCAESQ